MFKSKHVTDHKLLEDVHEESLQIPSQINRENNLLTSNSNQVCVCVQTNILNAEFIWDKIFVTKWKLYEEKKPLRGSRTQEIHYPKTKLVTRHSYSHNPI
jgi:hypothetical protein